MAGPAFTLPHDDDGIAPYPGLRPFKKHESLLFFGRDRCLDGMAETLQNQRFLAVLGPSGSGKSSLVRSGLFPHLEAGLARKAGSRWTFIDIQHPRCRPYRALAKATLADEALRSGHALDGYEDASDTLLDFAEEEIAGRETELRRDPMSLARWWKDRPRHPDENLLLLVDQFEELFGYSSPRERDEVETFVDLLLVTASNVEAPIYVVLTMRSEFLGGCSLFDGFAETINRSLSLTPRMTRSECEIAITGPAFGRPGLELDPRLVNSLLNDMNSMAAFDSAADDAADAESQADADMRQADLIARRADQLPLMQHVLNWLWARGVARQAAAGGAGSVALTLEDYQAVGGLRGALTQHANEVLGDDPADIRLAERLFRAITDQPSVARGSAETSAVRRPRRLEELARETGAEIAELAPVIERFRADGVSMLTPDPGEELGPQTEIDISHESIIRQWDLLRGWIRDEADAGRGWQELLRSRTEEGRRGLLSSIELLDRQAWWKRHAPQAGWAERYGGGFDDAAAFLARSEKRAKRRRAMLLGGTAAIFALAAASGLFLVSAQNQALAARTEAVEIRKSSEKQIAAAQNKIAVARRDVERAQRETIEARRKAEAAQVSIKVAQAASEQARRQQRLAEAAVAKAKVERAALAEAATRTASVVLGVSRNMIDQAAQQPPMAAEKTVDFADRMIPSLEAIDLQSYDRIRYQREVLRARSAYLDLDPDALAASAQVFDKIAARERDSDWGAGAALNADLARGRAAALHGDFLAADRYLANAASQVRAAGGRVPADTGPNIAAQRARLRLGSGWIDILASAVAAGSWRSNFGGDRQPNLDVLRGMGMTPGDCGETGSGAAAESLAGLQPDALTAEAMRIMAFAPYPADADGTELSEAMCGLYVSLGGRPAKSGAEPAWREVADRLKKVSGSRDEIFAGKAAFVSNVKERDAGAISYSLASSVGVMNFSNAVVSLTELSLTEPRPTLERSCNCPGKASVQAALENLAAANRLYEPANFQRELAETPEGALNFERDTFAWFPVYSLYTVEGRLRTSDAAMSQIPFVQSMAARELAATTRHYLDSLVENALAGARRTRRGTTNGYKAAVTDVDPDLESASRANLVEVASQSIAWRAEYVTAGKMDDRAALAADVLRDAQQLLEAASGFSSNLFYSSNIAGLRDMVAKVCQTPIASSACVQLSRRLSAMEEDLLSTRIAPARGSGWSGWIDEHGVALGGLDPVSITSGGLSGRDVYAAANNTQSDPASDLGAAFYANPFQIGREGLSATAPQVPGVAWAFSREANRDAFVADPTRYLPQIGGFDVTALFGQPPKLVPPGVNAVAFAYKGKIFYVGQTIINLEDFNDAAMAYALDAYAKLSDPSFSGEIAPYPGRSPIAGAIDTATDGAAGTTFR